MSILTHSLSIRLKKTSFIGFFCFLSFIIIGQTFNCYLYIGTHREAKDGIHVYQFNMETGDFAPLSIVKDVSNPQRQEKSHVHSVNFTLDNKFVFVPDLGIDKIMTYAFDAQTGQFTEGAIPYTVVSPGSGPRHFTFHPNGKFAYVIQELNATITGFMLRDGALEAFQTVKTLPDDYTGRKSAADIHISPDGHFLYGSNRVHDSLVIFSIDNHSGALTFVGHQSVNGKTPRNFAIDPRGTFILVANQDSDNITIFKRNKKTGTLTIINKKILVSQPVCLTFILNS